jgi:hypothetical protein
MVVVKRSNTMSILHLNVVMIIISQICFSSKTIHNYGLIHFCSTSLIIPLYAHHQLKVWSSWFFSLIVRPSFPIGLCITPLFTLEFIKTTFYKILMSRYQMIYTTCFDVMKEVNYYIDKIYVHVY